MPAIELLARPQADILQPGLPQAIDMRNHMYAPRVSHTALPTLSGPSRLGVEGEFGACKLILCMQLHGGCR